MLDFESKYFSGQFLIATPALTGSCFEKSVIYICNHDDKGAMGIIVNNKLNGVMDSDIFAGNEYANSYKKIPVYFGGPVEPSKGFVLHTSDYEGEGTLNMNDGFSLTVDPKILASIKSGVGPKKSILALGYAGWAPGQLEQEVMENTWINSVAYEEVLFDMDNQEKWTQAAKYVGIEMYQYSTVAGNS